MKVTFVKCMPPRDRHSGKTQPDGLLIGIVAGRRGADEMLSGRPLEVVCSWHLATAVDASVFCYKLAVTTSVNNA